MLLVMIFLPVIFTDAKQLIFANVAYRHGHRTPNYIYPSDPYQMDMWKEGMMTLTDLGKIQMYDLGRYIRRRYTNFLPFEYGNDVYVESSDRNRTIASAVCLLSGLYDLEKDGLCVLKQVIPIHVINRTDDNKINNDRPCQKYNRLIEEVYEKNITLETKQRYNSTLQNLGKHTNLTFNTTLYDINLSSRVYDTLYIENTKKLQLPTWTNQFFPEPLKEMALFIDYVIPYYTKELKRLRCGPLIKDMIQHFEDKIKGKSTLKMWQYSGHDATVSHVLQCLNVFEEVQPVFASAVFLELYKNLLDNKYEVLLTYKKNENVVEGLTVPGCELYCPYDRFKEIAKEFLPDDWDAECNASVKIHFKWIIFFVSWIFWCGFH